MLLQRVGLLKDSLGEENEAATAITQYRVQDIEARIENDMTYESLPSVYRDRPLPDLHLHWFGDTLRDVTGCFLADQ